MAKPAPVVVIGAGPVGLCLALALAQQEVSVTLVEAMSDDNFLDQVPRAGSNHPTTLEFFDRIGLYAVLTCSGLFDCSRRAAALTIMSGITGTRLK